MSDRVNLVNLKYALEAGDTGLSFRRSMQVLLGVTTIMNNGCLLDADATDPLFPWCAMVREAHRLHAPWLDIPRIVMERDACRLAEKLLRRYLVSRASAEEQQTLGEWTRVLVQQYAIMSMAALVCFLPVGDNKLTADAFTAWLHKYMDVSKEVDVWRVATTSPLLELQPHAFASQVHHLLRHAKVLKSVLLRLRYSPRELEALETLSDVEFDTEVPQDASGGASFLEYVKGAFGLSQQQAEDEELPQAWMQDSVFDLQMQAQRYEDASPIKRVQLAQNYRRAMPSDGSQLKKSALVGQALQHALKENARVDPRKLTKMVLRTGVSANALLTEESRQSVLASAKDYLENQGIATNEMASYESMLTSRMDEGDMDRVVPMSLTVLLRDVSDEPKLRGLIDFAFNVAMCLDMHMAQELLRTMDAGVALPLPDEQRDALRKYYVHLRAHDANRQLYSATRGSGLSVIFSWGGMEPDIQLSSRPVEDNYTKAGALTKGLSGLRSMFSSVAGRTAQAPSASEFFTKEQWPTEANKMLRLGVQMAQIETKMLNKDFDTPETVPTSFVNDDPRTWAPSARLQLEQTGTKTSDGTEYERDAAFWNASTKARVASNKMSNPNPNPNPIAANGLLGDIRGFRKNNTLKSAPDPIREETTPTPTPPANQNNALIAGILATQARMNTENMDEKVARIKAEREEERRAEAATKAANPFGQRVRRSNAPISQVQRPVEESKTSNGSVFGVTLNQVSRTAPASSQTQGQGEHQEAPENDDVAQRAAPFKPSRLTAVSEQKADEQVKADEKVKVDCIQLARDTMPIKNALKSALKSGPSDALRRAMNDAKTILNTIPDSCTMALSNTVNLLNTYIKQAEKQLATGTGGAMDTEAYFDLSQ